MIDSQVLGVLLFVTERIYIYIHIYRKKLVESDRMYIEKVKRKKNMFDGLFICQRVSTSIFF